MARITEVIPLRTTQRVREKNKTKHGEQKGRKTRDRTSGRAVTVHTTVFKSKQ